MNLTQHHLSAAFPPMPDAEFIALVEDIRVNGQFEPAVVFEGQVVDGWHRVRACKTLGIAPKLVELEPGVNPAAFALSKNLCRRHMTESQRALAIAECSQWAPTGRPKNSAPGAECSAKGDHGHPIQGKGDHGHPFDKDDQRAPFTVGQMAKASEVAERTIQRAKIVAAQAVPEVKAKVKSGELSIRAAVEIAKLPPEEQVAALEKPKAELKPKAKPALQPKPEPELEPLAGHDSEVDLAHTLAEYEQVLAENAEMLKVFEADDQLKAAWDENKRLRHENDGLRMVISTLTNEKNEAIRLAKQRLNKLKKAGLE